MKLDPRHLVQLAAIVETGSFQAAADLLGLSQPAISRNIKALEARLRSPVFDRSERKAVATPLGRRLARQGMIIQSAEAAACSYADQTQKGEMGTLSLGAPPTLAAHLLTDLLGRFLTKHEHVTAELRVGLADELRALLIQGRVNVVIGPVSIADEADELMAHDLANDSIGILCRAGHPLARVSQISPTALEAQKWAAHSRGSLLRYQTDQALTAFGVRQLNIAIETDSVEVAFGMVRQSDIVTTMPKLPSRSQLVHGDLQFLEFNNPLFARPIGYIHRASQRLSRAETNFLQFVKAELNSS